MKYAGIIKNDVAAAPGISLSFYTQGCPHQCPGCHNPETWNFNGGKEFTIETLQTILNGIEANGIKRNLCILGGEPLCPENAFLTYMVIKEVKDKYPDIKVYIWSGYLYEHLVSNTAHPKIHAILELADYLIDSPFIASYKDLTLKMRGSSNQRIWNLKEKIDITNFF